MAEPLIEAYHGIVARLTAPDGPFAISEQRVGGVRVRTYVHAHHNVADIYAEAEARHARRVLVVEGDLAVSFAETFGAASRFGAALQDQHGIAAGDRVGIFSRNCPAWLTTFIAVTRIGAVAVLFNSRASVDEFRCAAAGMGCKVLVADSRRAKLAQMAGNDAPIITISERGEAPVGDDIATLVALGRREVDAVRVDADAPAAILFTSGSTGRPKGAVLSQRNLCTMAYNLSYMGAVGLGMAAHVHGVAVDVLKAAAAPPSSLLIFPMFHVSGITSLLMALQEGGTLATMRRWNAAEALDIIARRKVTLLAGPALVLSDVLAQPNAAERLAGITSIGVGGQSTPGSLLARLADMLPMAQYGNGWGMTEVSGSISSASGALYHSKPGTCGVISPVMDVCVVDDDGRPRPQGEVGEFAVRGPLVMSGYWGSPEGNAAAFRDGWFLTGDVGSVDEDDFVFLVGRKKDMVICGGENIYSAEVERVLSANDHLVEVALFGVLDERLGERAVAAVTPRNGATCTAEDLRAFVRESLADYKVPSEVVFDLGALPRNALGKVDKAALRERYLARANGSA